MLNLLHSVNPASRDQTTTEAEYSKGMTIKYRVQSTESTEYRVQGVQSTEYREYRVQESMARVHANQRVSLYID